MKQQVLINLVAALFVCFFGFILFAANTGQDLIFFELRKSIPMGDKVGHLGMLGLLTVVLNLAMKAKTFRYWNRDWLVASVIIAVLCTFEEFSQIWIARRNFDLLDLAANYLGILLASFLILKMKGKGVFSV